MAKRVFKSRGNEPGLAGSSLIRPSYNDEELKKAVDVVVDELLPPPKRQDFNLVTLDQYNQLLTEFDDILFQFENSNILTEQFRLRINELEQQVQDLETRLENAGELEESLKSQLTDLNNRLTKSSSDLNTAIQRATQAEIQNAELTSTVNSLQSQISSLNSLISGGAAASGGGTGAGGGTSPRTPQPPGRTPPPVTPTPTGTRPRPGDGGRDIGEGWIRDFYRLCIPGGDAFQGEGDDYYGPGTIADSTMQEGQWLMRSCEKPITKTQREEEARRDRETPGWREPIEAEIIKARDYWFEQPDDTDFFAQNWYRKIKINLKTPPTDSYYYGVRINQHGEDYGRFEDPGLPGYVFLTPDGYDESRIPFVPKLSGYDLRNTTYESFVGRGIEQADIWSGILTDFIYEPNLNGHWPPEYFKNPKDGSPFMTAYGPLGPNWGITNTRINWSRDPDVPDDGRRLLGFDGTTPRITDEPHSERYPWYASLTSRAKDRRNWKNKAVTPEGRNQFGGALNKLGVRAFRRKSESTRAECWDVYLGGVVQPGGNGPSDCANFYRSKLELERLRDAGILSGDITSLILPQPGEYGGERYNHWGRRWIATSIEIYKFSKRPDGTANQGGVSANSKITYTRDGDTRVVNGRALTVIDYFVLYENTNIEIEIEDKDDGLLTGANTMELLDITGKYIGSSTNMTSIGGDLKLRVTVDEFRLSESLRTDSWSINTLGGGLPNWITSDKPIEGKYSERGTFIFNLKVSPNPNQENRSWGGNYFSGFAGGITITQDGLGGGGVVGKNTSKLLNMSDREIIPRGDGYYDFDAIDRIIKLRLIVNNPTDRTWNLTLPDWITTNTKSGTGNSVVTLNILKNNTDLWREGVIRIQNFEDSYKISQISESLTGKNTIYLIGNQNLTQIPNTGLDLEFIVIGDNTQSWVLDIGDPKSSLWVQSGWFQERYIYGAKTAKLNFKVIKNDSNQSRTATLNIRSTTGEFTPNSIVLTQLGSTVSQTPSFDVTPRNININNTGGTNVSTITVNAQNTDWNIPNAPNWMTLTRDGNRLLISAQANTGSERTFNITITPTVTTLQPIVVTATQSGRSAATGNQLRFRNNPQINSISNQGITLELDVLVEQFVQWNLSSVENWILFNGNAQLAGNGPTTVQVTIQPNQNQSNRTSTILLEGANGINAESFITLTQLGTANTGGGGGGGGGIDNSNIPTYMEFSTLPTVGRSGQLLTTQPVLLLKRDNGTIVTNDNQTIVEATLPRFETLLGGNSRLDGTKTIKAVNGIVTFTDLRLTGDPGSINTLRFTTTNRPQIDGRTRLDTNLTISNIIEYQIKSTGLFGQSTTFEWISPDDKINVKTMFMDDGGFNITAKGDSVIITSGNGIIDPPSNGNGYRAHLQSAPIYKYGIFVAFDDEFEISYIDNTLTRRNLVKRRNRNETTSYIIEAVFNSIVVISGNPRIEKLA